MSDLVIFIIGESLLMTALLIGAVLLLRRPVANLFGARLAYALWLIPALRLVLPPLPGGEVVIDVLPPPEMGLDLLPADTAIAAAAAAPGWIELAMPWAFPLWIGGAMTVLAIALLRHLRWVRDLLRTGTLLDPVDGVPVVMSASVDGPVAIGLWRPLIVVPADFFARYSRPERELAIAHELAHHRAGDLWANAAALVVLAAQWFNPLAWRAVHAFRFDQEAACDARVIAALAPEQVGDQAHSYACAIAKSVAGPRRLLAAPMTSGTKVKERLLMLTQNPRLGWRPAIGKLLLGGVALAALALTVSSLPARVVNAAEPVPPVADAPPPPGAPVVEQHRERHVIFVDADGETSTTTSDGKDADGAKRTVHRIVVHGDEKGDEKHRVMMFHGGEGPGADGHNVEVKLAPSFRMTRFAPNHDALRATLKEQGIDDAKIEAIIKKLEENHVKAMPRVMSWSGHGGEDFALTKCKDGENPRVMIDRNSEISGGQAKIKMIQCHGGALPRDKQVAAMKKARDRLAAQTGTGMSAEIRASVVADLDKSIAELESKKD